MMGILYVLFVVCWLTGDVNGQCGGRADIVIAIPGAHEVPHVEFAAFEKHLIDLLYHFKLTPSDINIGLIVYGAKAEPYAYPQPFKNRLKTNTRVSIMTQQRLKYTDVSAIKDNKVSVALRRIRGMLMSPPPVYKNMILRHNTRKIGIIYVWGKASTVEEKDKTIMEADKLRRDNVVMYALGTNGTGEEFERIGTDRCRLFSMGSFTNSLSHALKVLADGVCSELDPSVTVEPDNCYPKHYGRASPIISNCGRPDYRDFADPNNCAYHLSCEYQKTDLEPQRQRCAEGTLYSSTFAFGICIHMHDSMCYVDLPNCAKSGKVLLPHPNQCGKFINCGNGGIPYIQDCPGDLVFDVTYGVCNNTQFVDCIKGQRP